MAVAYIIGRVIVNVHRTGPHRRVMFTAIMAGGPMYSRRNEMLIFGNWLDYLLGGPKL